MSEEKPEKLHDYELVSVYQLDPEDQEKLLLTQRECVFNWCTADEWPMGVIMSCIWRRDRMWLTAGAHRHRISAVRRNPKVSVVVTSTGTSLGPAKTVTIKGICTVHEGSDVKDWFYPEFSQALYPDETQAASFQKMLDSPLRVVLEVVPEKFITYDGIKMMQHTAGQLPASRLSEPLEADTVRLARELRKRDMA